MKKTCAGLMMAVVLMGGGMAWADEEERHGILGKIGDGVLTVWNLVPKSVEVVNDALHFICGKVHTGVHATGEFLKVEALP